MPVQWRTCDYHYRQTQQAERLLHVNPRSFWWHPVCSHWALNACKVFFIQVRSKKPLGTGGKEKTNFSQLKALPTAMYSWETFLSINFPSKIFPVESLRK